MKILVTDKIVDEGIDILKGKGYEVDERFGLSQNELLERQRIARLSAVLA